MNRMLMMRLSNLIAIALLVEAYFFLRVAYWMTSMYRGLHASGLSALVAGGQGWIRGLLCVVVAFFYWRLPQARPGLRILLIVGALLAFYERLSTQSLVSSYWGIFHGDVVALSAASSLGLMAIGLLAVIDHYATKPQLRY